MYVRNNTQYPAAAAVKIHYILPLLDVASISHVLVCFKVGYTRSWTVNLCKYF